MSWTLFFLDFLNKGHYDYNIYLSVSKLNMFVGFHKFLNGYYGYAYIRTIYSELMVTAVFHKVLIKSKSLLTGFQSHPQEENLYFALML